MSQEQFIRIENPLLPLQAELQKEFQKDLDASAGEFSKHVFAKIADFVVHKQTKEAGNALGNYFRGYKVPREKQEAILFTIEAFLEKNGPKIDEVFGVELQKDDKPIVLQSKKAIPRKESHKKREVLKNETKKLDTPATQDEYVPSEAFKKYLKEDTTMSSQESTPSSDINQNEEHVAEVHIETTTQGENLTALNSEEITKENTIEAKDTDTKKTFTDWLRDPSHASGHEEKIPEISTENKEEELVDGIPNLENKNISITEDSEFVTFVFADKKNPRNRDSLIIPVEQKERIEEIKEIIKLSQVEEKESDQEIQKNKKEDLSFTVGQTFKTKDGNIYTISKVTGTFVYLEGKKEKIESIESLSQLIQEGTLTKVQAGVPLSVNQSFYDENGTPLTIKEIKGSLIVFTDGKNEHNELKTNVQEYLKSGAFTRVEKTAESLDEQKPNSLESQTVEGIVTNLTHFSESAMKKLMDRPMNWPKDVLDILSIKEIVDINKTNLIYGAEEMTKYEPLVKQHKLEKIRAEIAEDYAALEKINARLAEIQKLEEAYTLLSSTPEEIKITEEVTPSLKATANAEEKGVSEKISQPIELLAEDTTPTAFSESLMPKPREEEKQTLGEYVEYEDVQPKNEGAVSLEIIKTMYAKYPNVDDATFNPDAFKAEHKGVAAYEMREHPDGTATLTLTQDTGAQNFLISDYKNYMVGFELLNTPTKGSTKMVVVEEGLMRKQGDNWMIEKKPKIRFVEN